MKSCGLFSQKNYKSQLYRDCALMCIKTNTEAWFWIKLKGKPSVSAALCGCQDAEEGQVQPQEVWTVLDHPAETAHVSISALTPHWTSHLLSLYFSLKVQSGSSRLNMLNFSFVHQPTQWKYHTNGMEILTISFTHHVSLSSVPL